MWLNPAEGVFFSRLWSLILLRESFSGNIILQSKALIPVWIEIGQSPVINSLGTEINA